DSKARPDAKTVGANTFASTPSISGAQAFVHSLKTLELTRRWSQASGSGGRNASSARLGRRWAMSRFRISGWASSHPIADDVRSNAQAASPAGSSTPVTTARPLRRPGVLHGRQGSLQGPEDDVQSRGRRGGLDNPAHRLLADVQKNQEWADCGDGDPPPRGDAMKVLGVES